MSSRKRRSGDLDRTEEEVKKKSIEISLELEEEFDFDDEDDEEDEEPQEKKMTMSNPGSNPGSKSPPTANSSQKSKLPLADRLSGFPTNVTQKRADLNPPLNATKTVSGYQTPERPRTPISPVEDDVEGMEEDEAEFSEDSSSQASTNRSDDDGEQDEEEEQDEETHFVPQEEDEQNISFSDQIVENEQRLQEMEENKPTNWDTTDQGLIKELNNLRNGPDLKNIDKTDNRLVNSSFPGIKPKGITRKGDDRPLLLVVDTNIFVSQLGQLKKLIMTPFFSGQQTKVVLYLPRTVLFELIALETREQNPDLQMAAGKANSFLYDLLMEKSPKIIGQTGPEEEEGKIYEILCQDKILSTCLSLSAATHKVLLYTNDKNLAAKAKVNGVQVSNSVELQNDINALLFGSLSVSVGKKTTESAVKKLVALTNIEEMEKVSSGFKEIYAFLTTYTKLICEAVNLPCSLPVIDSSDPMPPPIVLDATRQFYIQILRRLRKLLQSLHRALEEPKHLLTPQCPKIVKLTEALIGFFYKLEMPMGQPERADITTWSEPLEPVAAVVAKNSQDLKLMVRNLEYIKSMVEICLLRNSEEQQ